MIIIDVREPDELAEGCVDGAINIPVGQLVNSTELYDGQKDEELILYCNTGRRSAMAQQMLSSLGYTNVKNGINRQYVEQNYI